MRDNYINIAICDDNGSVLGVVKDTVISFFKNKRSIKVETYNNPLMLGRHIEKIFFNLIFLDIDMPELDGIELAKKIKNSCVNDKTEIIFVSCREDRVFEAFDVEPFGFVRKSNFSSDVIKVLERYLDKNEESETFSVNVVGRGLVSVLVKDIKYFEGMGRNQNMYLKNQAEPFCLYLTMEDLEKQFSDKGFIRIQRSYLVNFLYIKSIGSQFIKLISGEELPIRRGSLKAIKEKFLTFQKNSGWLSV